MLLLKTFFNKCRRFLSKITSIFVKNKIYSFQNLLVLFPINICRFSVSKNIGTFVKIKFVYCQMLSVFVVKSYWNYFQNSSEFLVKTNRYLWRFSFSVYCQKLAGKILKIHRYFSRYTDIYFENLQTFLDKIYRYFIFKIYGYIFSKLTSILLDGNGACQNLAVFAFKIYQFQCIFSKFVAISCQNSPILLSKFTGILSNFTGISCQKEPKRDVKIYWYYL